MGALLGAPNGISVLLSPAAVEELAETFQLGPDLINNQHRKAARESLVLHVIDYAGNFRIDGCGPE